MIVWWGGVDSRTSAPPTDDLHFVSKVRHQALANDTELPAGECSNDVSPSEMNNILNIIKFRLFTVLRYVCQIRI